MDVPQKGFTAKVRRTLLLYGTILLILGMTVIAMAMGRIPGFSLRAIGGSTSLNQAILLLALSVVGFLGGGMLFVALRGIDRMALTDNGIVFPLRSLGGMLRGTPELVPFERIVEATAIPTRNGKTVIEFLFLDARGRRKNVTYTIEWAENPSEFERLLSERVKFRRARS